MAVLTLPRSLVALFPQVPRHLEIEADSVAALIRALENLVRFTSDSVAKVPDG